MSQRRTAASLEPAVLAPTPTRGTPLGTARVRVYIDDGYRAQNPGFESKTRRLIERASKLLEPTMGLRLELADIRPWQRGSGDDLDDALEKLEAMDPAEDVDWVLGLIDALTRVSGDLHQLGRARVLGRHMVVRGLNDAAEVAMLDRALGTLSERQRQGLYSRRKRHKELLLLLHELAHTLGALHVTDPRNLLYPSYEHTQSSFGPQNARLMRAVAAARIARGGRDDQREWQAVLAYLRENPWVGWNEDEKGQLLTELESRAQGAQEGKGESLGDGVRPADRERFRAAERLEAAGRPLDAWEELEPLIDYYPDEPGVQRFACRLAVSAQRDRSAIETRCKRAAQAAPGDAEPHLRLAQAHLAAKDQARSLAAARKAQELLERGGAAASDPDRVWADLAHHYQSLGAVTWAEQAAGHAASAAPIGEWARTSRARYGIAPKGPVKPEREAEYVAAIRDLLTAIYERQFPDAEKRAAQLQRTFPGAAGISAARCDMEIRRRRYPQARQHCRDALCRYADSSWAHYLIGLLDKRDKNPTAALQHLERAITLDPDLEHPYQVAAELYQQLSRPADKQRLSEKYRTKFGRDL